MRPRWLRPRPPSLFTPLGLVIAILATVGILWAFAEIFHLLARAF